MITNNDMLLAFGLTLIAGLSTGIGSLIALLSKKTDTRFLSASLGLSAGVMIYVSFMELMPESVHLLSGIYSEREAYEIHSSQGNDKKLKRTGVMMALAIGIHNFPEGLATFTSALTDLEIAIPIVFAIAIHNIPEGVAVSVPIYHSTGSRRKAFWYSFLSGMAEPIGAMIGILFLIPFWTPSINALLLALVSGIMVYISFDELLPSTEKYGHHHWGITGVISGMAIMAVSLLLI